MSIRDSFAVRFLDQTQRDLRLASRSLRATPIVTAAAIISLALAIGANTAIFSIVNSLLLRTLPVRDPQRLVLVTDTVPTRLRAWTYQQWEQFQRRPHLFESTAAWSAMRFNLASGGETDFINGLWATGSLFDTLGVPAVIGRTFTTADDQRGGGADGPVAVISHRFWQRRFDGAGAAIGSIVRLNTVPFTIIGVTPPDFFGPEVGRDFDVLVPLHQEPLLRGPNSYLDSSGTNFLSVIARLHPGQSIEAATAALRRIQPEVRAATLGDLTGLSQQAIDRYLQEAFTALPASTGFSTLRVRYEQPLITLMAVSALVLLIACVNVANLLQARAIARRYEFSLAMALGASRWRLGRQLLTESLVLAGVGAVAGLIVAMWGSELLVSQLLVNNQAVVLNLPIDSRVLSFALTLTMLTTLLFGIAPALRASRVTPMETLKEHGRGVPADGRGRLTGMLVVAQVALSMVLLVAAGLFVRSFISLTTRDLGFTPDQVVVVTIDTQRAEVRPDQRIPLYARVREAVLALPNIADAGVSYLTPIGAGGFTPAVQIAGMPTTEAPSVEVFGNLISPGWLDTFGMSLLAGRDFTNRDRRGAPGVVLVNEAFAKAFLGGANPLGRSIVVYAGTPRQLSPIEIVGLVKDSVYGSARSTPPPAWYAPFDQFDIPLMQPMFSSARLSVRATTAPAALTRSLTSAITALDPRLALTFQPLATAVNGTIAQDRLLARLATAFGVLALVLAAVGLYGVTAYSVSRRRTEIGIRVAMGARPARVMQLVLARLTVLIACGIVAGVGLSMWLGTFVTTLLYKLEPRDPATLAAAALILCATAAFAGLLPAWRASRREPIVELRR